MNSQDKYKESIEFHKPWQELTGEEKKQILSVLSEEEYNHKQKTVSAFQNHFKNEFNNFEFASDIPQDLILKPQKSLKLRIMLYSSIAAASILLFLLVYFKENNKHNEFISNNKSPKELITTVEKRLKEETPDTIKPISKKKLIISEKELSENKMIEEIINASLAESNYDEVTEYLLTLGKEEEPQNNFEDLLFSPIDSTLIQNILNDNSAP
jgi:hypothetical protein